MPLPTQKKAHDYCPYPSCRSEDTRIDGTYKYSDTYIVRYHVCNVCGGRFKTVEDKSDKPFIASIVSLFSI